MYIIRCMINSKSLPSAMEKECIFDCLQALIYYIKFLLDAELSLTGINVQLKLVHNINKVQLPSTVALIFHDKSFQHL